MTLRRLKALEALLEDSSGSSSGDMATKIFTCLLLFCASFDQVTSNQDSSRLQKIRPWEVKITNNGYDILVGISEEVPQSKMGIIIRNLQTIMTAASTELQRLTGGRASFNKVTIVVPNKWASYAYADGETASKANIHISPLSFTEPEVQLQLRGKTKYRAILLPVDYVETRASDINVGSVILWSWLKLRYEVDGLYVALQNEIRSDRSCTVAPVKNKICKALLADFDWENRTPPQPIYSIVRQRSKRVVMIIDVSGSMFYMKSRIDKAKEGLKQYIINLSNNNETSLGLVAFSTDAETLSNLTNIEGDKDIMVNTVVSLKEGYRTSIGSGLGEALNVLSRHPEQKQGAEFILISDGEETDQPFINETAPDVIKSKITVHTIAFSNEADSRIDALGAATGGLTFIHREDDTGSALPIAFQDINNYDDADPAASGIVIFSQRSSDREFNILIDERIGINTSFLFECPEKDCEIRININSPRQRNILNYTFPPQSAEKNTGSYKIIPNKRAAQLEILFLEAENGTWKVRTEHKGQELGLTVKSLPKDPLNNPILAFSFWGKDQFFSDDCANDQTMYTLITRDNNPVTDARVLAVIQSDDKEYGPYPIYDDGVGRDAYKDDGIYTGMFPNDIRNLTKFQRFNLKVTVNGTAATQVKTRQLVAVSPKNQTVSPVRPNDGEKVEGLQRSVLGGTFTSMAQDEKCRVCETDLVLLIHPTSPIIPLKGFLFSLLEFYSRNNKSRVWTGIISVDSTETPEVVAGIARSVRVSQPLAAWKPSGSINGDVNFAQGLKQAARMLSDSTRRKAVVLITERGISNVDETVREAQMLRAKGTELISVVVSPTSDRRLESAMAMMVNDQTKLVTIPNFTPADLDTSITRIINQICGFSLKTPLVLP